MAYTLVIIDMQAQFRASEDKRTINNCKKQIRTAIKDRAAIIFVEFNGFGPTLPELTKLTEKYNRSFHITKSYDDGSRQLKNFLLTHRVSKKNLKFCGVNTNACVLSTVYGTHLKLRDSNLTVIADACNSTYGHKSGLLDLKRYAKVK